MVGDHMVTATLIASVSTIVVAIITGIFARNAAHNSGKVNDKVGNGFAERVLRELMDVRGSQDKLTGMFEEHIREHEKWRDSNDSQPKASITAIKA